MAVAEGKEGADTTTAAAEEPAAAFCSDAATVLVTAAGGRGEPAAEGKEEERPPPPPPPPGRPPAPTGAAPPPSSLRLHDGDDAIPILNEDAPPHSQGRTPGTAAPTGPGAGGIVVAGGPRPTTWAPAERRPSAAPAPSTRRGARVLRPGPPGPLASASAASSVIAP